MGRINSEDDFMAAAEAALRPNGFAEGRKDRGGPPAEGVILLRADTIEPEPTKWIWPGWLAGGELQLVAGAPSTGKTTLALSIAAIISVGGKLPDGVHASIGEVLIWSSEDSVEKTIIPRLIQMGPTAGK